MTSSYFQREDLQRMESDDFTPTICRQTFLSATEKLGYGGFRIGQVFNGDLLNSSQSIRVRRISHLAFIWSVFSSQ
jgi:hypothetical protein